MSTRINVGDASEVGSARRAIAALAARADFDETEMGALAIVASELASNLAKHARDGVLLVRLLGDGVPCGIELLSLDRGPGIRDLARAMADGFSTGGTSGHGLGAIRRMSQEFDLVSTPAGTAIVARLWNRRATESLRDGSPRVEGVVCLPLGGEGACGDGWTVHHSDTRTVAVVVDGLGHGPDAARAADVALRIADSVPDLAPAQIVQRSHAALRPTRGAALAVAEIRAAEGVVRFAGVGNIAGVIAAPTGTKSLASMNGTAGHIVHKINEFSYPWTPESLLVMHSDGIMTRWKLEDYPGLVARHPSLVAGVLWRDFVRGRDDATVLTIGRRSAA